MEDTHSISSNTPVFGTQDSEDLGTTTTNTHTIPSPSSSQKTHTTSSNQMELATAAAAAGSAFLPAALTFKILTHNMWCHYLTKAPNKVHRMHNFVREVGHQNYDVVLLQELFIINILGIAAGDDLRRYMSDEFKKLGYEHQALGTPPPMFFGQTAGLIIFSKHPISTYEERRWYKASDFGTGKGYIHALINIHGKNVHFFDVHLDAHGAPARAAQLKILAEDLPKPYSNNYVVIAGDYNIDKNATEEYTAMMEHFTPRDLYDIYADEYVATHNSGANIDHVVVSNKIQVVDKKLEKFTDKEGVAISDHYGITATLELLPVCN